MSKKRNNAGEGYGYMFSGAFKHKSDAVKKESTRKGSFVKGVETPQGHRYVVMTPRTNPRKNKPKPPTVKNPTELLVMGANPTEDRDITLPAGSTITIRVNPARTNWMSSARASIESGSAQRRESAYQGQQRARRKATRAGEREADTFYSGQRQRSRARGKASKVFHELFSANPATCGATIGGLPCTRKPGHRGPHLPQGATLRPKSRLRRAWNPSAAALRERFTGSEADVVTIHDEPHMPAGDYAQLGELLALYVKPYGGGQVQQITFPKGSRPLLVADETARQIYFVGGNQEMRSLDPFRSRNSDIGELGECRRIDYKQRKEHVPHPSQDEWRHAFGEEGGVLPVLIYDARNKRLLLKGGEYRIEREGIIN